VWSGTDPPAFELPPLPSQGREPRAVAAYARAGKKLDMGKSCLRFKSLDDLLVAPVAGVIASRSVEQFIARCEASRTPAQ